MIEQASSANFDIIDDDMVTISAPAVGPLKHASFPNIVGHFRRDSLLCGCGEGGGFGLRVEWRRQASSPSKRLKGLMASLRLPRDTRNPES